MSCHFVLLVLRIPTGVMIRWKAGRLHTAHPDDPALGVYLWQLVTQPPKTFLHVDDRDENRFSLNPGCVSTFSRMHNSTWVVHHVTPQQLRCMWASDTQGGYVQYVSNQPAWTALSPEQLLSGSTSEATQAHLGKWARMHVDDRRAPFPDLCPCASIHEELDETVYHYPFDRIFP